MLFRLLLLSLLATPVLAADRTTHHTIALPAGPFELDASVETIKLVNAEGKPTAEIVTTAFLHPAAAGAKPRPVTFAFNGGPGSASAWLDVGALGPWRVPLAIPVIPSQDATPVDNADTWLDFTDLVFIDPPGTGYSRAIGEAKPFYTVQGDIDALATTIHRWLEAHHRLASPVYLAGESYGGFRGPRVARTLLEQQGLGVRGMVLLSPLLDYSRDGPYDPMRWVATLPSMAAAHRQATSRAAMADVEAWAAAGYLIDLVRGPNDAAAQSRIASSIAAYTGLPEEAVRRFAGRLDWAAVLRDATPGQVASPYDATLRAADPFPANRRDNSPDPVLDGLRGPFTTAMLQLYARLDWQPDGAPARHYELLSGTVGQQWDLGRGGHPESMTALRQFLALDPTTRVLVVHGLYDVVTPYFASALLLDQVPATVPPGRLTLQALPGGHMFYTNDASRHALHDAAQALVAAAP